ncbi:hypothetical protein V1525DRAFT_400066 [Lipomyces kononenkoae]|uniref:Uncharacterized protein n=1 Tax=Lipomyces kononenkoae TaxID=34357 RepID=A0ACC3T575_LIPKO
MRSSVAFVIGLCAVLLAPAPTIATVSIVDLLSSSPDFTLLVRVLQRTGLIPVLNMARNITFFAPSDEVLQNLPTELDIPTLLQYMIITDPIVAENMTENEAVYFSYLRAPVAPDVPLPLKVQRVSSRQPDISDDEKVQLVIGSGAAKVVKHDWVADNGVIQVVDAMVPLPDSLCDAVAGSVINGDMHLFSQLFVMHPVICYLLQYAQDTATLIVPVDSAFDILNDVELSYLMVAEGHDDRLRFVGSHFLYSSIYRQNDTLGSGINVPSMSGAIVSVKKSERGIIVNDHIEAVQSDVVFQNGVIHTLPSFLTPWAFFEFSPRKYLFGLNATQFTNELLFHGYGSALDDTNRVQTIFAPVDATGADIPLSANALEYHFTDSLIDTLNGSTVLPSRLSLASLDGHRQHIQLTVDENAEVWVNGKSKVLRAPIRIGNTAVIPIDRALILPPSLRFAAGSVFEARMTLQIFQSLGFFDDDAMKGLTIFFPVDSAWEELGSVGKFMLSGSGSKLVKQLLCSLMLTEPVYSSDFSSGKSTEFETRAGMRVSIKSHNRKRSIEYNIGNIQSVVALESIDLLFDGGVVHTISSIPIPECIKITPRQLLHAEHITSFVGLLESSSLAQDVLADDSQYIILAPKDSALAVSNITTATVGLATQMGLHILRQRSTLDGSFLSGLSSYDSLVSGVHITVLSELSDDMYALRIVSDDALSESIHPIRVLSRGASTSGAEIYIVDRVLPLSALTGKEVPAWWQARGVLVALGASGGILAMVLIGLLWLLIIYRGGKRWGHRQSLGGNDKSFVRFRRSFSGSGRSIIIDANGSDEEEDEDDEVDGEGTPLLGRTASGRLGSRVNVEDFGDIDEDAEEVELPSRSNEHGSV